MHITLMDERVHLFASGSTNRFSLHGRQKKKKKKDGEITKQQTQILKKRRRCSLDLIKES